MNYDYLSASNGSGDAALMHIESARLAGSATINVDTVANVPAKFIGTWGTLGSNGLLVPSTIRNFRGRVSGADVIIDAMEPGSTDNGNTEGQVIIIKPNTGWTNRVATFIKNATGFGTPEAVTFADITADDISASTLTTTGNVTVGGNLVVTGTSRVGTATTASGSTITPTAQIYDVTALAVPATINVPSFAANNGMSLLLRIKDNGTGRALTFAAGYSNVSGIDTPTTTVANKLLTIGAVYNSATSKWEIQGINQQA